MNFINGILFFILQFIFTLSQTYLQFQSNYDSWYSITIKIEPNNWRVILDTINSYFLLYDNYESNHSWATRVIKKSTHINKGKDTKIKNYGRKIKVTSYSSPVTFKIFTHEINQFYYYYTQALCPDKRVWNSVEPNIRQLSLGLGLNVKNKKFSFIHSLYDNNIINKRVFSFEHTFNEKKRKVIKINLGEVDNQFKQNYKFSFVSTVPFLKQDWGIYIHSIGIGNKYSPIRTYAKINTGIKEHIRSYVVYKIFKEFFIEHPVYKKQCKEYNLHRNIITIVCDAIKKEQMNEEVSFIVNDNVEFAVSLNNFFVWTGATCKLDNIYFDSNNRDFELQVGQGFLELFDFVEFNFDKRDITYFSRNIIFKEVIINNLDIITLLFYVSIMMICNLCLLIYEKIKFIN